MKKTWFSRLLLSTMQRAPLHLGGHLTEQQSDGSVLFRFCDDDADPVATAAATAAAAATITRQNYFLVSSSPAADAAAEDVGGVVGDEEEEGGDVVEEKDEAPAQQPPPPPSVGAEWRVRAATAADLDATVATAARSRVEWNATQIARELTNKTGEGGPSNLLIAVPARGGALHAESS
jgi:hypothetical protein